GVVGCRLNVLFGAGIALDHLERIAVRVARLGWHIQLLIDVQHLAELVPRLTQLPVPIVIDHMGHMPASLSVDNEGFQALLSLLRFHGARGKPLGAYRLSAAGPPYADTDAFAHALVRTRPERLVWGSDWPHVALDGPMPNVGDLLDLLADWVPDEAVRERIL